MWRWVCSDSGRELLRRRLMSGKHGGETEVVVGERKRSGEVGHHMLIQLSKMFKFTHVDRRVFRDV